MPESVAIITGASQGIGRATALRLAKDFSAVVLAARSTVALKEVAAAVRSTGAEPLVFALDLSRRESAEVITSRRFFLQNILWPKKTKLNWKNWPPSISCSSTVSARPAYLMKRWPSAVGPAFAQSSTRATLHDHGFHPGRKRAWCLVSTGFRARLGAAENHTPTLSGAIQPDASLCHLAAWISQPDP
jgi:hypothetical protein